MAAEVNYDDEETLNSPFSRVYLCPKTEQIINCAMGLSYPIDVDSLKKAFSNSIMINHPRFSSLMVTTNHARQHWIKTHVNIDDHFILHHVADDVYDVEAAVNAYLADVAVSTPLSTEKPLWEVHVLIGLNCIVLRVHHAVGDGVSLMSMLSACFGKKRVENDESVVSKTTSPTSKKGGVWGLAKSIWFTLVFALKFLGRFLWVKDEKSVVYGGDGVELWPRKLETLKFQLQDFISIKHAIPNATVNDVLLGVISCGLSKYIQLTSPKAMLHGFQPTGLQVVNLRQNPLLQKMEDLMRSNTTWGFSSWGNRTGIALQPLHCCKELHPLEHVKKMKSIADRKKQSYEPLLLYIVLQLIASLFGSKAASWCSHRILCNTTLLISNIMGPSEELAIADNPVTYIRVNISSLPQAITLHLVSYAGKADLQVMVARDIISDSQLLAKCFQDSLLEMKTCNVATCNT